MQSMDFNSWMVLSKEIALVIFFSLFVAILIYAFWPGNRQRFEKMGRTVLEEDEEETPGPPP